jgi:hypothetical protein
MFHKARLIRVLLIPACLVWGVREFVALQRCHLKQRRLHKPAR